MLEYKKKEMVSNITKEGAGCKEPLEQSIQQGKIVKPEVKEVFTDGKLRNNWESEESRKEGKVDVEGSWERGIEEER